MPVNLTQLNDMQQFDWNTIIRLGSAIDDLNDRQWRFAKGLIAELTTEKYSNNELVYIGADHRDFDWPKYNIGVELKSQFSKTMFKPNGALENSFDIKFNNSNGTNKEVIDPNDVAEVVIVARRDGAFAIDKNTVLANLISKGDGFTVKVTSADIDVLTPTPISNAGVKSLNLKENITNAIKAVIP
jgi:hypothetical protein